MTFFFCLSDKDECLATCQDRQETFRWTHTDKNDQIKSIKQKYLLNIQYGF